MPIIDFPYYLDSIQLRGAARGVGSLVGYETVNGVNAHDGDLAVPVDPTTGFSSIHGQLAVYGNVNIDGTTYLGALASGVGSLAAASPTVSVILSAEIETTSLVEAGLEYGEGRIYLPKLVGFGSTYPTIQGITYLPSLQSSAELGWYIPEPLVGGYALLTGLASAGLMKQPDLGEAYLPTPVSQGWVTTTGVDEVFVEPINAEAKISGFGSLVPDIQIDGIYLSSLHAELQGVGTVYNNITIDGVTYTGAYSNAVGSVVGTASVTHPLQAAIAAVGTFNPSNDLGQSNPWVDGGGGFAYLPSIRAYGYTGERLEVYFNSWLYLFNANVGYGIYTHNFDGTLAFTDHYISLLASAILVETLPTSTLDTSSSFSTLVTGELTLSGTLNVTGLQEAYKFFTDTFTSNFSGTDTYSGLREQILTFASELTFTDVYEALKQIIGQFISTLDLDDALSAIATYQAFLNGNLRTVDNYLSSIGTTASPLVGSCATWVIDIDTQASVQYDKYNFSSYAKHGDTYIATAEDGIYELSGSTDAGADISSLIDLATSRFATPQRKYFPSVYLGVTSSGKLLLKAEVDGQTWVYEANNTSANMANQRIDIGRGLVGSHWRFTLLNQDGLDFDLESVEFLPFISSRRAY